MRYEIINDFLTPDECNQIITMAKTRLAQSYTWDVVTASSKVNDYRKSEQMFFNTRENPLVASIEERIAQLTGLPVANGEGLQVVFYKPGGYYYSHWDYFSPEYEGNQGVINRGGQRIATVLMYLNNMYTNFISEKITPQQEKEMGDKAPIGDTWFEKMDLSVKPDKVGKTIFWWNVKQDGVTVDPTTYHSGRPVPQGGTKIIMTKWLRAGTFR
jgi:prolyl 4-hydroxylase